MNKSLIFFVICLILSNCGGNSVTKPSVLVDIEMYANNGIQAYSNAEWRLAHNAFYKALQLYQGIDNQEGVLLSYINLAEVSLAVHDYVKSKQYLTLASVIAKDKLFQHYHSRITLLYALIALQQEQLFKAEQLLQKILPAFDDTSIVSIPDAIQLAAIASRTKIAFLKKGDALLWTSRYENALKKTANKNIDRKARLLRFQSNLLLQQGHDDEALLKMQQALSLYKQNISRAGIAVTLLELGQYYRIKQHWQEAENYLNRSKAVYNSLGNDKKVKLITDMINSSRRID